MVAEALLCNQQSLSTWQALHADAGNDTPGAPLAKRWRVTIPLVIEWSNAGPWLEPVSVIRKVMCPDLFESGHLIGSAVSFFFKKQWACDALTCCTVVAQTGHVHNPGRKVAFALAVATLTSALVGRWSALVPEPQCVR